MIEVPDREALVLKDPLTRFISALGRADPVLGGLAPWVACALLMAAVLLLTREDRRRVKGPFWLLICHLVFVGVLAFIPRGYRSESWVSLIALTFVLASIARSVFLLFAYSFWMRKVARPLPKILRDVIQGFAFSVVFLLVLRSAGVEPGSLLATSALLTAVIGLSLQDTLGNLFAGLAIQAQRPFEVGDWVQLDSQSGPIGRVIEINWRATRVITLDQVEMIVPNGLVAKNPIVNFSLPKAVVRRETEVFATSDLSPELMRRVLLRSIEHVDGILASPPPAVYTRGFSERGMSYMLRYFIERFDRREFIDSAVRERIWYAMQRANMTIPVPRRHIEILDRSEAPPKVTPADRLARDFIRQNSLFQNLSEESQDHLASACRRKRYAPEELIVHKGDTSTEMYLIESGRVRIELPSEDGRSQVAGELGAGEFFGEMSLMTGEARAADIATSEETSVLVIDREALVPLLERHPELVEHLSRVLAERRARLAELAMAGLEVPRDSKHDELELVGRIRRFFGS